MSGGEWNRGRIEVPDSHRVDILRGRKLYRLAAILPPTPLSTYVSGEGIRSCGFVDCPDSAEYKAEFVDGSYAFVCPEHATALSRESGWPS